MKTKRAADIVAGDVIRTPSRWLTGQPGNIQVRVTSGARRVAPRLFEPLVRVDAIYGRKPMRLYYFDTDTVQLVGKEK